MILLAGFITRTFKTTCTDCATDLISTMPSQPASLIGKKDRGGLIQPAEHVLNVCLAVEKATRLVIQTAGANWKTPQLVKTHAMGYIVQHSLNDKFNCIPHSTAVIKELIERYASIRLKHEATRLHCAPVMRSRLNRLVIFSHV